jgi:hypothetical protein
LSNPVGFSARLCSGNDGGILKSAVNPRYRELLAQTARREYRGRIA